MAQQAVRVFPAAGRLFARDRRRRLGQRLHPDDPLHFRSRATQSAARRSLPERLLRLRALGPHHGHNERLRAELVECRTQDLHDDVLSAGEWVKWDALFALYCSVVGGGKENERKGTFYCPQPQFTFSAGKETDRIDIYMKR